MQNLVQNIDFLVCLAIETTSTGYDLRRNFTTPTDKLSQLTQGQKQEVAPAITDLPSFLASNSEVIPRVIHLDWCVCSVKDFKVLDSSNAYVNPGVSIDEATTTNTLVTQEIINSQGLSFTDALQKLLQSIELTTGSGKYRVCSFGDWVVHYQLELDALRCGTALTEKISQNFLNVLELHYDQNPTQYVGSLDELLAVNELELIRSETKAKTDGASLVRILNRMIRSFKSIKAQQHQHHQQPMAMGNYNESTEESKMEIKRGRSRSRSQDRTHDNSGATGMGTSRGAPTGAPKNMNDVQFGPADMVALKMRGLPWRVEVEEIEQFFSRYAYVRESIQLGVLQDGRKSGQAALLFVNPDEAASAMNEKQGQNVGSRWVELYQMPYSQYQGFMDDQLQQKTVNLRSYLNEENINRCVKLRGIPYQASQQDVKDFFGDFGVADDDVVIEMRQGKKTGFALVFLRSEQEVQRARQDLNKQYIGSRFIDVMIPRLDE